MTETTEMIKAIANDSKVRIDRIVANYEQLEKENAELKEQVKEWKALQELYDGKAFKWQGKYDDVNKQLTEAKEHIRTLISCLIDWVQEGDKYYCYIAEAEQFLKDSEEA